MSTLRHWFERNERWLLGAIMGAIFLLFWEGLARGWWADALHPLIGQGAEKLRIRPIFLSSPSAIAVEAWRMYVVTGEIWPHLGVSAAEVVIGLGGAVILGIPFGLISGRIRLLSHAVEPFMTALNATPQVAFIPLIILWMGTGYGTRIFIIFLLCIIPIFMASHAAVKTVDVRLLKVAASFGASETHLFRTIILPGSIPFLLAGLRLAIGRAMIGIVVGELYGSAIGIGLMINKAGSTFQTASLFVGVLTIVIAGLALTEFVRRIERRVEVWRPEAQQAVN